MEGIVLINKPKGLTSRDVVNRLNYLFNTKRIGHTGTLDPIATGVLVCCIGKYTKLVDLITAYDKEYIAEIKLGVETDTQDITGEVIKEEEYNLTKEEIEKVFQSFIGKYLQTVPKYSAVKIKGKKLYEYARNNENVDLPKREVEIFSLELLNFNKNIIKFKTRVSKGTYIRSLITDICSKLNTIGTMSSLVRTKQGIFSIDEAFTLENIESGNYNLLSIDKLFAYPRIDIDEKLYKKIFNGAKILNEFNIQDKVMFFYENKCVALYEKDDQYLKSFIQL